MATVVKGEGPVPCDLMFVGEGPSREDERAGRPMVGPVGRELNRYIWHSCQRMRTSVYVTNLFKQRIADDADPTDADITRDGSMLVQEIRQVRPKIIASVGRWSTRWFLGDVDMDAVHGLAHARDGRIVVPCIHPAAGLHSTEFQAKVAWDFEQLGKVVKGVGDVDWEQHDQYLEPAYRDVPYDVDIGVPAAVDTEGLPGRPWGLSLSTQSGTGINLRNSVAHFKSRVIMHSALHDLPVLRSMGIFIGDDQFDDTMIKSYLLCVEPQGLKALCRRWLGMDMQDYQELMRDAQRKHSEQWLNSVLSSVSSGLKPTTTKKGRTSATSASAGKKSARTYQSKQRR